MLVKQLYDGRLEMRLIRLSRQNKARPISWSTVSLRKEQSRTSSANIRPYHHSLHQWESVLVLTFCNLVISLTVKRCKKPDLWICKSLSDLQGLWVHSLHTCGLLLCFTLSCCDWAIWETHCMCAAGFGTSPIKPSAQSSVASVYDWRWVQEDYIPWRAKPCSYEAS